MEGLAQYSDLGVSLIVVGGCAALVKMLFGWFTKTIDADRAQIKTLTEQLMMIVRETSQQHVSLMEAIQQIGAQNSEEHLQLVRCLQSGDNGQSTPPDAVDA